jgi:hypothetical protein
MANATGSRVFTRRGIVGRALAAVAGAALVRGRSARASAANGGANVRTVWVFDPTAEGTPGTAGCAACAACRRHAAHKIFASREAAEARRAHPHCRCAIVAVAVPAAEFVRLFGEPDRPGFRGEFDRRWSGVMGGLEMPAVRVR